MARKVTPETEKLDNVIIEGQLGEYTVAEIKHSTRVSKSTTPKGDLSWWIKWIASIIVLVAVAIRSAGVPELMIWDMFLSWIGAGMWAVVGFMWKDRAILLLNSLLALMLFSVLLREIFA